MKRFYLILSIVTLLGSEIVPSNGENPISSPCLPNLPEGNICPPNCRPLGPFSLPPPPPPYIIYILSSIIVILLFVVIGLLLFLYKHKDTIYNKTDEDKLEISINTSSSKYQRHPSTETSELTLTRENSDEDSRFKLVQRQNSKLSIFEYPDSYDTYKKKREEPQASTTTLSKIMHKQPGNLELQKAQIEAICRAVIEKTQNKKEFSSLTNLENAIQEESNENKLFEQTAIEKSASSGLLDVVDNFESLPSPLSVKKVIRNFEVMPSPKPVIKFNKRTESKPENYNKTEETNKLHLHFRLPEIKTNNPGDTETVDNKLINPESTYKTDENNKTHLLFRLPEIKINETGDSDILEDKSSSAQQHKSSNECDTVKSDQLDEIYIDAPSNRPVSCISIGEDIYENPPINKPVPHIDDCDEIYVDTPNNRPVSHLSDDNKHIDEIYDDIQCNKLNNTNDSLSSKKTKEENERTNSFNYDIPSLKTGDALFDKSYINARSLKNKDIY